MSMAHSKAIKMKQRIGQVRYQITECIFCQREKHKEKKSDINERNAKNKQHDWYRVMR